MLIKIRNPIESVKEKSALADDVDAGERAISILNTSGFADNDYILIGKMGEEQTELIQISTVSGSDTLNLSSNLSHNHTQGHLPYFPHKRYDLTTLKPYWKILLDRQDITIVRDFRTLALATTLTIQG